MAEQQTVHRGAQSTVTEQGDRRQSRGDRAQWKSTGDKAYRGAQQHSGAARRVDSGQKWRRQWMMDIVESGEWRVESGQTVGV